MFIQKGKKLHRIPGITCDRDMITEESKWLATIAEAYSTKCAGKSLDTRHCLMDTLHSYEGCELELTYCLCSVANILPMLARGARIHLREPPSTTRPWPYDCAGAPS